MALGGQPAFAFYVPGRVEILGKHTDYAGGRTLTCAIDRGFVVAVSPRNDGHVLIRACDKDERGGFELCPDMPVSQTGWMNYCTALARRLARNFGPPLVGADIAFAANLPAEQGISSSSALLVAMYLALNAANGFDQRDAYRRDIAHGEDLAGYLGACENGQTFRHLEGDRGVGTLGGSEDHTAILCSKPGMLNVYSYRPVRLERRIEFPAGLSLVIATSGVRANKTGDAMDAYNRLSRQTEAIMACLRQAGWDKSTLAAAIGDDREAADCVRQILGQSRHREFSAAELVGRFEQFAMEHQQLIPAAADALQAGDWDTFGRLSRESQLLAESNLGNQIPQTTGLADSARRAGAIAASAFGAGFGGSIWAMVRANQTAEFVREWKRTSQEQAGRDGSGMQFLAVRPVGGAGLIR